MASYATVPATDLESEATLLNSKPKTKTSLLVGGVAAAAFVLGVLSMTALSTSPSVRSAAFDANTGRTDPINIILFGSKERAETDDGADSEQNQQWVFTCPAEGDCGNQV